MPPRRKTPTTPANPATPVILPSSPFAGIDEAGRGCLAGPVVAAAVILPEGCVLPGLADSKKLSSKQRDALVPLIREQAVTWGLGVIWPRTIERINILQATFLAMARAAQCLRIMPPALVVDGNKTIPVQTLTACGWAPANLPLQQAVIGGDDLVQAISAASILAKTFRDNVMTALDRRYPGYGFAKHKGYGTAAHYECITRLGPCPQHRMTFRGVGPETETKQLTLW